MSVQSWSGSEDLRTHPALLLEASAGTGKTYQIAHMVARLVAGEGCDPVSIDRLLVMTFTDAATAELRDRVRRRLVDAIAALEAPDACQDALLAQLASPDSARTERLGRLRVAVQHFDLAKISTIHGFSQRSLSELAFDSGEDAGLEVLTDVRPLRRAWIADQLERAFAEVRSVETAEDLVKAGLNPTFLGKAVARLAGAAQVAVAPQPADVTAAMARHLDVAMTARGQFAPGELGKPVAKSAAGAAIAMVAWLDGGRDPGALFTPSGGFTAWVPRALTVAASESTPSELPVVALTMLRAGGAYIGLLLGADHLPIADLATRARPELDQALRRANALSFDAMLSRLADAIADQGRDGALANALAARYDAALIDEFQDTDSAQWQVLRAAFRRPGKRLVLIGDPKQAIYAFRGADIAVYSRACSGDGDPAPYRATMTTNFRSDAALLDGLNRLWTQRGNAFAVADFDYVAVRAPALAAGAPSPPRFRLDGTLRGRPRRPIELRWLDARALGSAEAGRITTKSVGQRMAARACRDEVLRLLDGQHTLALSGGAKVVGPGDIAVLVRANYEADLIAATLRRAGVPAITAGKDSVLGGEVAGWLVQLLEGMADPRDTRALRSLVLTPLFGWSIDELQREIAAVDAGGETPTSRLDQVARLLASAAQAMAKRGLLGALQPVLDDAHTLDTLLRYGDGDRWATDLRHLLELLQVQERSLRLDATGLADWLRAAGQGAGDEVQPLRLERDDQAVRVVTMHKAKGLEYPIVLLPMSWYDRGVGSDEPIVYHGDDGELVLDLHHSKSPQHARATARYAREQQEEARRLLYVAMTRAKHHLVVWYGPLGRDNCKAPFAPTLAAVLLGDAPEHAGDAQERAAAEQREAEARMAALADHDDDTVGFAVEPWQPQAPPRWSPPRPDANAAPEALAQAATAFGRRGVGDGWQRPSYSSASKGKGLHEPVVLAADAEEREEALLPRLGGDAGMRERHEDEADDHEPGEAADGERQDASLASAVVAFERPNDGLGGIFGGKDVGVWVHAVFEHLAFAAAGATRGDPTTAAPPRARDGRDAATLVRDLGHRHGVTKGETHAQVVAALPALLATPIGGAVGAPDAAPAAAFCLRDLPDIDRIDELAFELGLAGGLGADGRARKVDGDAARWALGQRLQLEPDWPGTAWLRHLLASDAGVDEDAATAAQVAFDGDAVEGDDDDAPEAAPAAPERQSAKAERSVFPHVHGQLTGHIDLLLQAPDRDGHPRVYVCDYKTNTSKLKGVEPYGAGALWQLMAEHAYHYQALLYTVATHRLLRWRKADYDYERDVGGHLYLFLRGMRGADTPRERGFCHGVHYDRWPAAVIEAFDDALDGYTCAEVQARAAARQAARGER